MPSVRDTRAHLSPLSPQPTDAILSPQLQPVRNLYHSRPSRSSYAVRSITQEEEEEEVEEETGIVWYDVGRWRDKLKAQNIESIFNNFTIFSRLRPKIERHLQ